MTEQPTADRIAPPKLQFAKVRPSNGGPWAICEMRDLPDMIDGDSATYEVRHVWMTRAEFEGLKEFEGW
jgi:hypothetical protein